MKPDYKNWIPKGMLYSLIAGTVLSLALLLIFGVFGIGVSGKLRIALGVVFGIAFVICAKRNLQGRMLGIDRWGKEYASFSLPLCEKNAAAEGVKNISFQRGNAVKLDFPDERANL